MIRRVGLLIDTYREKVDVRWRERIARRQHDAAVIDAASKVGIALAADRKVPLEEILLERSGLVEGVVVARHLLDLLHDATNGAVL